MLTLPTTNFRKVLEDAGHQLAITPGVDLENEHILSWTSFATRAAQEFLDSWQWPEWAVTEERAFRPIWKANRQFYRQLAQDQPNECYFIPSAAYFRVKAAAAQDPPLGTLPTDTNFFEPVTLTERSIDAIQPCQRTLGVVFGVYKNKPQIGKQGCGLWFRPSERGLDVRTNLNTVWVHHALAKPEFSAAAYDPARSYKKGELMLWTDGECYLAVSDLNGQAPSATQLWRKVPLPTFLATYLIYKIAAQAEDDLKAAAKFEAQAAGYLNREIDKRVAQGQRYGWGSMSVHNGWCCCDCLPTWGEAAPVSTLTDECVDEWGNPIVMPGAMVEIPPSAEFIDTIDRLRGGSTALESLAIANRPTLGVIEIVIGDPPDRGESIWQIMLGDADASYPEEQVRTLDYNASTNNRHLLKVGER